MNNYFCMLILMYALSTCSSAYSNDINPNFYKPDYPSVEFRINPAMDPMTFEYSPAKGGFNILVRKEDSKEFLQTIKFPYPEFKKYKFNECNLRLEDYNFDGFLDIKLLKDDSNEISHFILLYNGNKNSFIYNKELSQLTNTTAYCPTKEIVSFKSIGFRSYIERYYKFINGKLTLVRLIKKSMYPEKGPFIFKITINELKNNKMVVITEMTVDESNCDSKESPVKH